MKALTSGPWIAALMIPMSHSSTSGTNQPNLLLITTDQQHFSTLGFANPHIHTPNLDRLAREGTNFTRAYCPNPTCTPTRASIITGLYPSAHGAWAIGTKLPERIPTIGALLHAHGYRTSLIGKAHFQPAASTPDCPSVEAHPVLRDLEFWRTFNEKHTPWYGFDHCEIARMHGDEDKVGQHYALWMEEHGLKDWKEYFQPLPGETSRYAPVDSHGPGYGWRKDVRWSLPAEFHYTTWTGERTQAQIREAHATQQPFFCWSSYHDPHPPYCVPEPWASMYDPADMPIGTYRDGEFDSMPPLHQLTREPNPDFTEFNPDGKGLCGYHSHLHDEETLRRGMAAYYGMISFIDDQIGKTLALLDELGIADNTMVVFTSDHGHFLGQHGLIHKGPFHYEDVLRVPLIARHPGRIPAGGTNTSIQSLVDLAPTFLECAGIETPSWMQGLAQSEAWMSGNSRRKEAIVEMHHNQGAVKIRTLVTDRYKLTLYAGKEWGELFDLQEDPGEIRNRFHDPAYTEVKSMLYRHLAEADLEREPALMPRIATA